MAGVYSGGGQPLEGGKDGGSELFYEADVCIKKHILLCLCLLMDHSVVLLAKLALC